MLESFVATQKLSVQKALRRKFRRFVAAKGDFNALVLLKLQVRCCCGGVHGGAYTICDVIGGGGCRSV